MSVTAVILIVFAAIMFMLFVRKPLVGLILYVGIIPFSGLTVVEGFGVVKIFGSALLLAWFANVMLSKELKVPKTPHFILVVLFCIAASLSVLFVSQSANTFGLLAFYISMPLIYLLITNTVSQQKHVVWIFYSLLFATSLYALLSFAVYLATIAGGGDVGSRLGGIATNAPNIYGATIISTIPIIIYFCANENVRLRLFAYSTLFVCLSTLVLTYNRGAIIGLCVIGLLIMLIHRGKKIRLLISLAFIAVLFYGMLPTAYLDRIVTMRQADQTPRYFLFITAINMVKENPWTGVGLNNYASSFYEFAPLDMTREANIYMYNTIQTRGYYQPHGMYTATLGEMGLIGSILLILLLMSSLRLLKRGLRSGDVYIGYFGVALIASLTMGIFYGSGRDNLLWLYICMVPAVVKIGAKGNRQ